MRESLIDTDILSMFLRGNPKVEANIEKYLSQFSTINISILTYYEIMSGLRHKNAKRQLESFWEFCGNVSIIPISQESADESANIYAKLKKTGKIIDDIDILIAGICLENRFVLVTNNKKHFSRIKNLKIENWSE